MAELPKRIKNYLVLDLLAQGGMAEIFRAYPLVQERNGQQVVIIKRILGKISEDSAFIRMFDSEAEITKALTDEHPDRPDERRRNIARVLKLDEDGGRHFIVMEYVNGRNLAQINGKYSAREPMPPEMAAYVIAKAAAGLHYAHEFNDPESGQHLNLVHRDIKPMNILVSYDGQVKLIDFGIAKGNNIGDKTDTGIIKGTARYLSPEQITGEKLDGRSDIFSLGIILWELLTEIGRAHV